MSNWIIIPTRNCLPLLKETIESARKQTIDVQFFIVNNGSTDGTAQWLNYQESINTDLEAIHIYPQHGVGNA
jgi:glycosyltransferase involved in cell wall biosynthesis